MSGTVNLAVHHKTGNLQSQRNIDFIINFKLFCKAKEKVVFAVKEWYCGSNFVSGQVDRVWLIGCTKTITYHYR